MKTFLTLNMQYFFDDEPNRLKITNHVLFGEKRHVFIEFSKKKYNLKIKYNQDYSNYRN